MLPAAVLAFIAKKYGDLPIQVQEYPIISTIRFTPDVAAGPPVVYTIPAGVPRTGFSYGVNNDMAPAGRAGVQATLADTNIQNAGQTRDQADVFIYGMSVFIMPGSDSLLVGDVMRETDLQIATNSDVTIPAGTLDKYPQPGGLYGSGRSGILEPALQVAGAQDGGEGVNVAYLSNGNPSAGSFRRFENPIFWAGLASGPDSNLQIIATPRRLITRTAALARAAGTGAVELVEMVAPFTPAAAPFAEFQFCLHAATVKRRGVNAG